MELVEPYRLTLVSYIAQECDSIKSICSIGHRLSKGIHA
jgi:hypothetical protein